MGQRFLRRAQVAALPHHWSWTVAANHYGGVLSLKKTSSRLVLQEPSLHEMQFVVSMLVGGASEDALPPEWQVGSWGPKKTWPLLELAWTCLFFFNPLLA
jgi:hypothetical protein